VETVRTIASDGSLSLCGGSTYVNQNMDGIAVFPIENGIRDGGIRSSFLAEVGVLEDLNPRRFMGTVDRIGVGELVPRKGIFPFAEF
jgi:hypothetical protein